MTSLSEGFNSLRERILPSGAVLSRGARSFFGNRIRTLPPDLSIWREVLAIDRVGIDDDFFELGGHSLLAVKMLARVQESLGILVPASLPGYPDSSVAIMRAGYLLRDGLYAEARRELLAAVAKDPDEPTLHLLLGQVYETIGLADLAQREFIDARDLAARR